MPNPSSEDNFKGPIFIVGMPRSGTKLLRDLLNQHPSISIPKIESHIIPYFVRKYGDPCPFKDAADLHRFLDDFETTYFYSLLKGEGMKLDRKDMIRQVDPGSWSSIFQYLLRYFGPKGKDFDGIWGDKTPGYVNHIPLLKKLFPAGKIIHIIRDPRDYSLSVHKTWGKSLYRAAAKWKSTLDRVGRTTQEFAADYMEVFYESLLNDSKQMMLEICRFLGISFVPEMLELKASTEYYGDAKGSTTIVNANQKKYLEALSRGQVQRIEQITYPQLNRLNYPVEFAGGHKPMTGVENKVAQIRDAVNSSLFHMKEKGPVNGLIAFVKLHFQSSWR